MRPKLNSRESRKRKVSVKAVSKPVSQNYFIHQINIHN